MSSAYDKAAEFCEIAGTPDLLEYLQLPPDASAEEAKAKLKARRKYMQGMQSNPKYRKEAIFLIKHFQVLSRALEEPQVYQFDALRRAESVHLPILEMTVKGVLAGGGLTEDQETYLRRNANELGVSDATFDQLLDRLCNEAGVRRPGGKSALANAKTLTPATVPPVRQPGDDFYHLLGLARGASLKQIRASYEQKMAEARALPPTADTEALIVRLDLAWSVLSDPRARETYHITSTRTGPPARQRDAGRGPPTAPPSRGGSGNTGPAYSPPGGAGSRLEILGEPVRNVALSGQTRTEITVRNGGSDPMTGRVSCEAPWVTVSPRQLDPNASQQTIEVSFDAGAMPGGSATATVDIVTDRGESAAITFHVKRSRTLLLAGAGAALGFLLLAAGASWFFMARPVDLRVEVDPWAKSVALDGTVVGYGQRLKIEGVSAGPHSIVVEQPNFETATHEVTSDELAKGSVQISLKQARKLDFVPTDEMRRTSIPQAEASKVFSARSGAIDACIEKVVQPGSVLTGAIRVHIDAQGLAAGLETQGKHTDKPDVAECLERQAAALEFSPLENGDYATVRYEYTVTAADSP